MKRPPHPVPLVITHSANPPKVEKEALVISFDELLHWIGTRRILRLPLAFSQVSFHTHRLDALVRPFLVSLILRYLSRGCCVIVDSREQVKRTTLPGILLDASRLLRDYFGGFFIRAEIRRQLQLLESSKESRPATWPTGEGAIYLRTDLWFGVKAGGSVTHIAGVLNNLGKHGNQPVFFSSDSIPLVDSSITQHIIEPPGRFWDFPEMPALVYNREVIQTVEPFLKKGGTSFIYQRYSLNNFSGAWLAKHHCLPFVLEYNGSEIWINRHWGRPLHHEELSQRIEMANFHAADLIVVVSEPMRTELLQRGIAFDKILVNPNGVDETRYYPEIDASELRVRLGLQGKTVIGFIGTFGPWHGTEVLLEAYISLIRHKSALKDNTHLLLIGDGARMPALRQLTDDAGIGGNVTFAGLVPQEEGPLYLAACDILAAPTLPNPDGTPFFGSPTKLFEYMAMGKAIVASDLDQIGQVLRHEQSALLVEPGNVEALRQAVSRLIASPELCCMLGLGARKEVCSRYTWRQHTARIISSLHSRLREGGEVQHQCS